MAIKRVLELDFQPKNFLIPVWKSLSLPTALLTDQTKLKWSRIQLETSFWNEDLSFPSIGDHEVVALLWSAI